jgi:hypothetical protein
MGEFRAKIAGRDVLASGSVVINGYENLELFPVLGDEYKVELVFVEPSGDSPPPATESKAEYVDDKHLRWNLVGFSNPLGMGTTQAVRIGQHDDRQMYLAVVVHTLGEGKTLTRVVNFTFSLGEAVNA